MTLDKKIVWEYKSGEKTEVHGCQPLPDGNVLVVECGTCRLLEIAHDGKVAKEIALTPPPVSVNLMINFAAFAEPKTATISSVARAST